MLPGQSRQRPERTAPADILSGNLSLGKKEGRILCPISRQISGSYLFGAMDPGSPVAKQVMV